MLIETQYFPCIRFWAQAQKYGEVKLEKYENYQKRSYRNKCLILAANGILVEALQELGAEISYEENWQINHIRSIKSAYTSSPYYEYYMDDIEELINSKHIYLYNFNLNIIKWFCKVLDITLLESEEYIKEMPNDLRHVILPKSRIDNLTSYIQVFSEKYEFQSDLSILDLIFCKGPEVKTYLKKASTNI
jgi:hypothetical protein